MRKRTLEDMDYAIALGSNIGDRERSLRQALQLMGERLGPVVACSSFFETEPLLHPENPVYDQGLFLNAVAKVRSRIEPEGMLEALLGIESVLGRERGCGTWEPRTIDLDIIACDERCHDSLSLTIPHPEMHKRRFVLEPLCEIWPDWKHPRIERSAEELLLTLTP